MSNLPLWNKSKALKLSLKILFYKGHTSVVTQSSTSCCANFSLWSTIIRSTSDMSFIINSLLSRTYSSAALLSLSQALLADTNWAERLQVAQSCIMITFTLWMHVQVSSWLCKHWENWLTLHTTCNLSMWDTGHLTLYNNHKKQLREAETMYWSIAPCIVNPPFKFLLHGLWRVHECDMCVIGW